MSVRRKSASSRFVQQPAAQFYDRFVESIKKRIRTAQIKAALAANAQLVLHYWEIGCDILASQKREGWGAKVIDRLERWVVMQAPTGQRFCVVRVQRPGFPKNANCWD